MTPPTSTTDSAADTQEEEEEEEEEKKNIYICVLSLPSLSFSIYRSSNLSIISSRAHKQRVSRAREKMSR